MIHVWPLTLQDLNEDDVMVLDSGDEVYVWVGRGSDDQEKEKAFAMAEVSLVCCGPQCMDAVWKQYWSHWRRYKS